MDNKLDDSIITSCGACGKEIIAQISKIVGDCHLCSDCYIDSQLARENSFI